MDNNYLKEKVKELIIFMKELRECTQARNSISAKIKFTEQTLQNLDSMAWSEVLQNYNFIQGVDAEGSVLIDCLEDVFIAIDNRRQDPALTELIEQRMDKILPVELMDLIKAWQRAKNEQIKVWAQGVMTIEDAQRGRK